MCAMEFGIYLLNVAKPPRAQERARAKRKGSYPTKKLKEFSTTPIWGGSMITCLKVEDLLRVSGSLSNRTNSHEVTYRSPVL